MLFFIFFFNVLLSNMYYLCHLTLKIPYIFFNGLSLFYII